MKRFNRTSDTRRASFESLEDRRLMAFAADAPQLAFGDVLGGSVTAARTVTFTNTGPSTVTIPAGGISIGGPSSSQFHMTSSPSSDVVLAAGQSLGVSVNYGATAIGPQGAMLQVI